MRMFISKMRAYKSLDHNDDNIHCLNLNQLKTDREQNPEKICEFDDQNVLR